MAPEMAAGYVVGWIPSLTVTGLHFWFHKKKLQSPAFQQLQKNLSQIQKFWSESQGRVLSLSESSPSQDHEAFKKSLLLMGTLFFFMSWLGFFFNLIVLLSVQVLAVSRFERQVFASELCSQDLPAPQVESTLKELEA